MTHPLCPRVRRSQAGRLLAVLIALLAAPAFAIEKASEQVSPFYGSFAHSLPVEVPGFRGLEPRIALSYSSEGRNGPLGVGWSLSGFSTIQRANKGLGTPMFNASDVYLLDGQELVACAGGSVSPSCTSGGTHSTKIESYQKIRFDSAANTWTVWSKEGTRTLYASIITVPAGPYTPGGTMRWGVSSRIDTDTNTVTYAWNCPAGDRECYPQTATYNGYTVRVFTETRPDVISWAASSVLGQTRHRVRSVVVSAPSQSANIRGYKLGYQTSPLTGRSLLVSVQQVGKDLVHDAGGLITGGTTLPAHTFTYQDDTIGKTFADWGSPLTRSTYSEPVTWANLVNAIPAGTGSSLYKTAGGENWNAGADSSRAIASGDGYVQWTSSEPSSGGKAVGLSNGNTDATLADIDFALQEAPTNLVYAVENGTFYGPWPRANGDVLRVEVIGNVVYYRKNGALLRQSTRTPAFPLRVDAAIYAPASTIQDVILTGALAYVNSWCQAIVMSGDFNGDGRTDQLCYATTGTPTAKVSLAGASGFGTPTTWLSGHSLTQPVFADFNNDGKTDMALYDNWSGEFRVSLSTGSAFGTPVLWGSAAATAPGGGAAACRIDPASVGAGDFNGDGVKDVYCKSVNPANPYQFIGLSNGTSAFTFSIFGSLGCDTYDARVGAIDFDGDGKDDWFCMGYQNNVFAVFTSDGTQFLYPAFGYLDGSFCSSGGYILADLNADGRTDAGCNNGKVALSTGRAFAVQGAYGGWCFAEHSELFGADVDGDGATEIVCNNPGSTPTDIQVRKWNGQALGAAETWRADWCSGKVSSGDWNGDGKSDLHCTSSAAPAVAGTGGRLADIVSTVNNGLSGSVQLVYTPSSAFVHTNNPSVKQAITSLTVADGRGWSATTAFEYSGGLMDWKERIFLGFRYAKKTLPCIAGESSCPYVETWFKQDLASAGKIEKAQRRLGSGNIVSHQTFAYTTNGTTLPRTSLLTGETTHSYDAVGCPTTPCAQEKRVSVTHSYDAYANRTQSTFTGDMSASGDERSTTWDFRANAAAYIVGLVAREQHFDNAGALKAATRFRYDLAGTWDQAPTKGHVTETERWLDYPVSRWTVASTRYDLWGNVISSKDPTNREITTTYDATYHLFPQTVANPAAPAESETTLWDPVCGLPYQRTDANGQMTTVQSDALCRKTRMDSPLNGFEATFYRDFGDPNWQRIVVETPPAASGGANQFAARHFDGLNRAYYTVTKGPSAGQPILTVKTFNARGSVASETAPYYAGDPVYTRTYAYDGLDRVTSIQHADGNAVTKTYGLWSETTTDENGTPTTLRFDAYGRTKVKEQTANGNLVQTVSTYDALDRQVGLVGPLNATWSWTFDSLGRNYSKTDPDAGTWTFLFDDAGRMTRQTDAKQQRTEFGYDAAGRPATRNTYAQGGALTATVTMAYSQARATHFNIGRLTTVSGPGATVLEMDYDARGRLEKRRRTLDAVTYGMRALYDAGDRLLSLQFPDLDTYIYEYDAAGRPKAMNAVLTDVLWDAAGRPTVQTNANGTVITRTYSPERGFLTAIRTTAPGTPPVPQDLQYVPDAVGLVQSVSSPFGDESWSYGYDDLYRLTSATGPVKSQTWSYDVAGRIETNSRVGGYNYAGVPFHAPSVAGAGSYAYDLNGQLLSGGGRTLTWNPDNRLAQVNTTQFTYDAGGERLKKTTGSNVSRYPFGDDYEITNGVVTKYITVPGLGVIGKKVSGSGSDSGCTAKLDGFYWFHKDRLGSIQAITNASGCEIKRRTYRAYGETIAQIGSHVESRGWIDQRQDDETGLTYLHARTYDPLLGIFVSPDPSDPNDARVGLNRFIYGLGSPVNGTDRGGLMMNQCLGGAFNGGMGECTNSAGGMEYQVGVGWRPEGGNRAMRELNLVYNRVMSAAGQTTDVLTYDDDGDGVGDRTIRITRDRNGNVTTTGQGYSVGVDTPGGCSGGAGGIRCDWGYTVTDRTIDDETGEEDYDTKIGDNWIAGTTGAAVMTGVEAGVTAAAGDKLRRPTTPAGIGVAAGLGAFNIGLWGQNFSQAWSAFVEDDYSYKRHPRVHPCEAGAGGPICDSGYYKRR